MRPVVVGALNWGVLWIAGVNPLERPILFLVLAGLLGIASTMNRYWDRPPGPPESPRSQDLPR